MSKTAIEVDNVSMKFNLSREKVDSLKDYIFKTIKREIQYNEFWALKNVSFSVEKGDRVGILGLNGAGKSTLLKVISGVFKPTEGHVDKHGKMVPLLELGAGFDPQYTGKENIYLYGAMLGYTKKFIDSKYDEIVEFSELQKFMDVPVKNYSSGMKSRLGFSIATVVEPKILILDEPTNHMDLAGKEALEKMLTSYEGTVLFVSHDRYFINQVATGILEFGESDVQFYGMNYAQYLEEIKRQTPGRETGNAGGVVRKPADVPTLDDVFDKKKYYNPGKILSRLKRQLEKYEEQLAESESRMSELQLEMMDPELSANYEQLMELQTKIDEENQVQESLLERMMETELELEEMETSESAFVRRQERY